MITEQDYLISRLHLFKGYSEDYYLKLFVYDKYTKALVRLANAWGYELVDIKPVQENALYSARSIATFKLIRDCTYDTS